MSQHQRQGGCPSVLSKPNAVLFMLFCFVLRWRHGGLRTPLFWRGRQARCPSPTFQALRIHLNDEFDELRRATPLKRVHLLHKNDHAHKKPNQNRRGMAASLDLLKEGGKIGIITWKHLECAIVVEFLRAHELARNELPLMQWCEEQQPSSLAALKREAAFLMDEPRRPTEAELKYNSRSRSAVLHLLRKQSGIRVPQLEGLCYDALDWEQL
ncbi:hypothetical protein T492DRAFT_387188 [Pavlovales sp. CCMP2436]|nr:hypothetical protein T492DRAFT_387188 [Pavlovales sp. CCMP2436]